MAKLSALQLVQEVQLNNGLGTSTALTALTGLNYKIWQYIQDGIYDIGVNDKWRPLEEDGTITLADGTASYPQASDLNEVDKNSFIYDQKMQLRWYSPQEIDRLYPTRTSSGDPIGVFEWKGSYDFINTANAANATKTVKYRHWKIPAILSTATAAGTSWFPEGFDRTVLVNYGTFRTLQYRHNDEFKEYKEKVFGRGMFLDQMKRIHRSPNSNKVLVDGKF